MKKRSGPVKKPVLSERGAIVKKGRSLIRTALVYPNTYRAGMSSLGFQTVYRLGNQLDNAAFERVFLPDRTTNSGRLKSIETGLDLDRFDIILFSISFENDFIHLVQLLEHAGIPLRSSDRNHIHPLVAAGGVACFLNPEPIADFMDCFLLGEAECFLENFFNAFAAEPSRKKFLETLEGRVPGAYVPKAHPSSKIPKIQVQYLDSLENITTSSAIITHDTAFKDTFLIETLKGCPHGCRFCSAGFIYRPPRIYPEENICKAIDMAKGLTDKIGFVSSAIADHPQMNEICDYGLKHNFRLSFASLRADRLTDKFIQALAMSRIKTATIAPEAGSERMRRIINKKIEEHHILSAAHKLVSAGIINLKLYFMIGLPFETPEDIQSIILLTLKIKSVFLEASKKNRRIGTITLSINPFIPKPCTPFQWAPMADEKYLKNALKTIRHGLKKTANIKINTESIKKAKIHALLSRGGRQTADIIESALHKGWARAIKENMEYCNTIIYTQRHLDTPLPWDFLDNRVKKQFLKKEFLRAQQAKKSPSCPMISCTKCQTCM